MLSIGDMLYLTRGGYSVGDWISPADIGEEASTQAMLDFGFLSFPARGERVTDLTP